MNDLGERLRRERVRRGMKQNETAARFGVSQPGYHRWETGENRPHRDKLPAIAQFLGLDIDDLYGLLSDTERPTSLEEMTGRMRDVERDISELRELPTQVEHLAGRVAQLTDLVARIVEAQQALTQARAAKAKPVKAAATPTTQPEPRRPRPKG